MYIISNDYDETIIHISFNRYEKADAIIINDSNRNENQIVEILNNSLKNAIMIINFNYLYNYFYKSGLWKYKHYNIKAQEIDKFETNWDYSFKIFCVFYIGENIQFSQIEDILESIRINNPNLEIMFSCCLDTKLKSDEIDINIFNKINE